MRGCSPAFGNTRCLCARGRGFARFRNPDKPGFAFSPSFFPTRGAFKAAKGTGETAAAVANKAAFVPAASGMRRLCVRVGLGGGRRGGQAAGQQFQGHLL